MRVLVCGGAIGESQANQQVRGDIVTGWRECVGHDNVQQCPISAARMAIKAYNPDLIFCSGSYLPETTYFGEMRAAAKSAGALCAFWATEDPYEIDAAYRISKDFDYIFTCDSSALCGYRSGQVYHLPLAGSPTKHFREISRPASRSIDILFCGVAFDSRKRIIRPILDLLRSINASIIGPGWGEFGKGFSDRRIDKEDLINLYANAKIVLNLGRSLSFENKKRNLSPSTPGPRTFEVALAGALQVFSEDTSEMRNYFDRDEILSFSNSVELKDIIPQVLHDEGLQLGFAIKAQKRALEEHTYKHRAEKVVEIVKRGLTP